MPRILIADDSEILRSCLKSALTHATGWPVCGEAANGQQAVLLADQLKPDLVILDFAMPILNGIEAAKEIFKGTPAVPVVIYTIHPSWHLELEAKRLGIRSVVSKADGLNVLIAKIKEVIGLGEAPQTPAAASGAPPGAKAPAESLPQPPKKRAPSDS